jgi:hypothetical protein
MCDAGWEARCNEEAFSQYRVVLSLLTKYQTSWSGQTGTPEVCSLSSRSIVPALHQDDSASLGSQERKWRGCLFERKNIQQDAFGRTPIYMAATLGNLTIVKLLL